MFKTAELPNFEEMAKGIAKRALDEYEYLGRTLREWADIIVTQKNCKDCIDREDAKQAIRDKFKTLEERCEINEVLNSLPSIQVTATSPCDLCRYNPPSSGAGKPCVICPAVSL